MFTYQYLIPLEEKVSNFFDILVYSYAFLFFLSFPTFDAQCGMSISKYNWYRFCNFNKIHHWIPISGRLMFYRIIVLEKKDKMVAIWQKSIQLQMSGNIQYSISLISWNTVAFTSNITLHQGESLVTSTLARYYLFFQQWGFYKEYISLERLI